HALAADAPLYLQVAVPRRLSHVFTYAVPPGDPGPWIPGMRVRVPFGRSTLTGYIVAVTPHADIGGKPARIREVLARVDETPSLPQRSWPPLPTTARNASSCPQPPMSWWDSTATPSRRRWSRDGPRSCCFLKSHAWRRAKGDFCLVGDIAARCIMAAFLPERVGRRGPASSRARRPWWLAPVQPSLPPSPVWDSSSSTRRTIPLTRRKTCPDT